MRCEVARTFWSEAQLDCEAEVNTLMHAFSASFMGGAELAHMQRKQLAEELGCEAWFGCVKNVAFDAFCARVGANWGDATAAGIRAWVERAGEERAAELQGADDFVRMRRWLCVGWALFFVGFAVMGAMALTGLSGAKGVTAVGVTLLFAGLVLMIYNGCCKTGLRGCVLPS